MEHTLFKKVSGFLEIAIIINVLAIVSFGLQQSTQFTRVYNAAQISTYSTINTRLIEQCGQVCAKDSKCTAVNYHAESGECQLSQTITQNGSTTYGVTGWDVLYKTHASTNCVAESCFIAVTTKKSWNAANNECISVYKGHLAYIKTAITQEFITKLLTDQGIADAAWLGGNDNETEGVFRWTDGSLLNDGFLKWSPRQPDNNGGNEDCLSIRLSDSSRWNDAGCTASYKSICEVPASS